MIMHGQCIFVKTRYCAFSPTDKAVLGAVSHLQYLTCRSAREVSVIVFFLNSSLSFSWTGLMNGKRMDRSAKEEDQM